MLAIDEFDLAIPDSGHNLQNPFWRTYFGVAVIALVLVIAVAATIQLIRKPNK